MDRKSIVVCFRVSDFPRRPPDESVQRDKCADCGEGVFISKETAKRKLEVQASICCVQCALKHVQQSERVIIEPPSKGQLEELRKDIEFRKNQFKLN